MRLLDDRRREPAPSRVGMRHGIRRVPGALAGQPAGAAWYTRAGRVPRLAAAAARRTPAPWESAPRCRQGGPRVLMATSIGSYAHAMSLESALAAALTFRGAEVHALLCDGAPDGVRRVRGVALSRTWRRSSRTGPSRDLCRDCRWPAERVYQQLGLKVHRYSDWLTPEDRAEAARIAARRCRSTTSTASRIDGLAIGEHAYAGALRFFATGSLDDEPQASRCCGGISSRRC